MPNRDTWVFAIGIDNAGYRDFRVIDEDSTIF
jgi:hypothetical protein